MKIIKALLLLLTFSMWGLTIGTCASTFPKVIVGAERMDTLIPLLQGKRIGLVVNQTSVVGMQQTHLLDTLLSQNINVTALFAPEHGFREMADAGATVKDGKDTRTGLPIRSLYGKNKKPTPQQLSEVDILIFDIQDVGARFYTYISTMHYVMEACAELGKTIIVLDRPNPNDHIDGPILAPECKSFVGMHPIPLLHGLTVGELARMINGEGWLTGGRKAKLIVIPVQGWKHGDPYTLPVKPSPNLPNQQSILLYPSLCLFEATQVSIGRGTPFPFQVIGYPDARFGKFTFVPKPTKGSDMNPLQNGKQCYGYDLRTKVTNGRFSLSYFIEFIKMFSGGDPMITRPDFFDLLAGTKVLRRQLEEGKSEDEIRSSWFDAQERYKKKRKIYLIYADYFIKK